MSFSRSSATASDSKVNNGISAPASFSDRASHFSFHYALGFDKYKGGLDTVHDLTGLYSVYSNWRGIEIMFHVSTQLPYEKHDSQKVGRCFYFAVLLVNAYLFVKFSCNKLL